MTQSYSGTVSDGTKSYNVSLVLSEIVNPTPVEQPAQEAAEPAAVEAVEDGTAVAQEMPVEGAV